MPQLSAALRRSLPCAAAASVFAGLLALASVAVPSAARAQALGYAPMQLQPLPQEHAASVPEPSEENVLPERLRRATVNLNINEPAGTVIIDTGNTALYYVLGQGRAIRYGVGVGREGFTWSGVQNVSRKAEWPDWYPPAQMIARQPYLPRFVAGGPGNPLGARAIYLGSSEYRIHGTNDASTIGKFVSSGCIRMANQDVIDLFNRVNVGTKVVVLSKNAPLMTRGADAVRKATSMRSDVTKSPSGREAMNVPASN